MIYFITIILIIIGIFRYDYQQAQRGRLFYYCLLLILFICIAGFRYRLGIDTLAYTNYMDSPSLHTLGDLKWKDFAGVRYMPGFILLASASKTIYPDIMVLQIAVSLILNIVVFRFFWQNTKHVFICLLLYAFFQYITLNMEVLRESLAVSFFLLAWPFFKRGKWLYYYLLALCAFLCHVSAYIMFLIPIICLPGVRWFFQFGKRTIITTLIILALSFVISIVFFNVMQTLAVTESMMERTQAYAENTLGGNVVNLGGILAIIFRYVLYPFLAMYFLNKSYPDWMNTEEMKKLQMLSILGIYIVVLSTGVFILSRYNNYLIFFSFVLVADWVFTAIKKNGKKIKLSVVSWALILAPLFIIQFYSAYWLDINKSGTLKSYMKYYPYSDAFSEELDPDREKAFQYFRRN